MIEVADGQPIRDKFATLWPNATKLGPPELPSTEKAGMTGSLTVDQSSSGAPSPAAPKPRRARTSRPKPADKNPTAKKPKGAAGEG